MNKPLEFFDKTENSSGNLAGLLSNDINEINGVSIEMIIMLIFGFISIVTASIFALVLHWKIGLYGLIAFPVSIFLLYKMYRLNSADANSESENEILQRKIISEAI